jgi:cellulose 1,4-beta-cellobiosidase
VENPFADALHYVNPQWVRNVTESQSQADPSLHDAFETLKLQPSAVWMDRIAAIEGDTDTMGLRDHLDEALAQQAANGSGQAMEVSIVIYNLPNRDCAAFASNGELRLEEDGMNKYKKEYVNVIAEIMSDSSYDSLRIVTVIEPDSLPNLVTNLEIYENCAIAEEAYREGVAYSISTLAELDNVYIYLDIGHSAWLGWDHTETAAQLYSDVLQQAGGAHKVRGFASNVAGYSSLREHFDPYTDPNANMDLIEGFYQWNRMLDEERYVAEFGSYFPDHGFLIDTARNGWAYVDAELPIDQRTHRGNWCNISDAGIGERPQANPSSQVDAYVWIKPPGESDGTSDTTATSPNDEGKQYDEMCGQEATVRPYDVEAGAIPTDSLDGAPHAGHWFHQQIVMLVENATPAL